MLRNLLISLLLIYSTASLADVELLSFRVIPLIDHGRLEWSSGNETDFSTFVVERSGNGTTFMAVSGVDATGSYSEYSYTDSNPLDVDSEQSFFYRLKLVNRDGSYRYSEVLEVTYEVTAVQQTWGSIKAMFR